MEIVFKGDPQELTVLLRELQSPGSGVIAEIVAEKIRQDCEHAGNTEYTLWGGEPGSVKE